MSNPWVKQIPTGGRSVTIHSQSDFNSWITNIQPFDAVSWYEDAGLVGGKLESWSEGVVVKGIGHAQHDGVVNQQARNNWYMGMHNIYKAGTNMNIYWADDAVVNCVIEGDPNNAVGVGIFIAGGGGSSKLLYGNVIRNKEDAIYIQNSVAGIDYIVHNYLGDVVPSANSYAIHEYAQSADRNNNCYYIQNVVANGNVLIGGQSDATLPLYNLFQENFFYKVASLHLNYKRPICCDLINNYLLHSCLDFQNFQGVGDGSNDPPVDEWSIVTGNEFYNPGGYHFKFQTSAYVGGVRQDGTPRIRTVDVWDLNQYYGQFNANFRADGVDSDMGDIQVWEQLSENAGKRFGFNDVQMGDVPPDQYWLIPNDYDPDRAMLVVWNGSGNTITIPFPRIATVAGIQSPYNESDEGFELLTGVVGLSTYVIRYKQQLPICNLSEARRLLNEALLKSNQKPVKKRIRLALQNMEGCE